MFSICNEDKKVSSLLLEFVFVITIIVDGGGCGWFIKKFGVVPLLYAILNNFI
jgi:hypothetical protein